MIDENRLAEIEERERNATPGPWSSFSTVCGQGSDGLRMEWESDYYMNASDNEFYPDKRGKDAKFIAYSRADVPWLVDLVKELRAEVVRLNQVVRKGRG